MIRRFSQLVMPAVAAAALLVSAWRLSHHSANHPAPAPVHSLAAVAATDEWPAFHGGGPLLGVAGPLPAKPLAVRWTLKSGGGHDGAGFSGGAAIFGGLAYVGDENGTLYAIDLVTGKPKWTYKTDGGFQATPLVFNGKVLIGDLDGTFHCINAGNGQKIWTFDAEAQIRSSANLVNAAAFTHVVFGSEGAVFCLNVEEGKQIWKHETSAPVYGAPAIAYGVAMVSGCDQHLHAMNLADGNDKFSTDLGQVCAASPAALADRVVVGTDGGRVLCFTPDGGKQLWLYDKVADGATVYASPATADGVVVVGARDHHVYGIDLETGKGKWSFATHADVDSSPAISGGRVYVGSRDKKLYVLDLKSGTKVDEFAAGKPIIASPAVGEGVVIIGDTGGNLYCLEPR